MSSQILDVPAKHSFSVTGFLDRVWNSLAESAIQSGWAPLTRLAEAAVISYVFIAESHLETTNICPRLMQKITIGQLRVVTSEHTYTFPSQDSMSETQNEKPELKAELRVVSDTFWVRLCAMGDLGFSEAYMYGDVECDDLISLFQVRCLVGSKTSNPVLMA